MASDVGDELVDVLAVVDGHCRLRLLNLINLQNLNDRPVVSNQSLRLQEPLNPKEGFDGTQLLSIACRSGILDGHLVFE